MGGGTWMPYYEDEESSSSLCHYYHGGISSDDESSSTKLENGESDIDVSDSISERQEDKVYAQVWKCYEDLHCGTERLQEVKRKVLSYTPGSWADRDVVWDECVVPYTTSLLLLGPKASGKSTLINNISKVFDDGLFASRRAHVPGHSGGGGTWYIQRYMIPRRAGLFCLYDTRSLSHDTSENLKEIERWMTKGVPHGELVLRESDSVYLKNQFVYGKSTCSSQLPSVNFVIFVVNGVSVLDAVDCCDSEREYWQEMASIFNYPLLSFRDDKPAVVVTHGDLLSVSDRVRIRMYLAELLGIHPTQEIFDIPNNNDPATALEIADMLTHCLECSDRNLDMSTYCLKSVDRKVAIKEPLVDKIFGYSFVGRLLVLLVLAIAILFQFRAITACTDIFVTGELASNSTLTVRFQ